MVGYTEDDFPDANDVYGISKQLGEVREPHAITLRTSILVMNFKPERVCLNGSFLKKVNVVVILVLFFLDSQR